MKKRFTVFSIIFLISVSNILHSQVFWNEVNSGVTAALRCVSNVDNNTAWCCGSNGTIIRSTNIGYNWVNLTGNGVPTTLTLINIFGIDVNTALTAGYQGTNTFVYRTSNGGTNWVQVFTEPNGFVDGVWMTSILNGFMVGDPVSSRWSLWKTTNGGINWDSTGLYLPRAGTEAGWNSSLWARDSRIWFGTNNSRIYFSSNNGLNWIVQSTSPELNSYTICIDSMSSVICGLAGGATLLKTTNSGTNWLVISAPGSGNIIGTAIAGPALSAGWFIRGTNTVYFSFYPFNNWVSQYTAPAGNYNHIAVQRQMYFSGSMIYAVRSNGGISRGSFFVEGVRWLSNKIPSTFKLYQNYPNPFNPSTKIKLEIPLPKNNSQGEIRGERIVIKIYDALGKETETVLDQITQPGIYEAQWDGTNYPSGVYFYRVLLFDPKFQGSAPEYIETRKMVLVK
jgi:photosystem II stability/assembly factor-like uncharacterized protein